MRPIVRSVRSSKVGGETAVLPDTDSKKEETESAGSTKPFPAVAEVNRGELYDVLVWGLEGSGKTSMLKDFCTVFGTEEGQKKLLQAKKEDSPHVLFRASRFGQDLGIIKCSGKMQHYASVRDQLGRTKWLFLVYHTALNGYIGSFFISFQGPSRRAIDRLKLQDLAVEHISGGVGEVGVGTSSCASIRGRRGER
uniref:Uncharacterized protein n=1 Tax=Chromera velia CCMP2878 TaxID=1169474 RepID=A0A0G4GGA5_9ALVE|eukprot:Cvel_21769.t1-p1 / transcript=Cvel_21769.t1 / gene=Cvel_21769 / organism=Chromera_velia_CCMP2878 / gene_product=hypothetical protein / transcript_product=hypothetical protein / location=Cvel_scaffold2070:33715-34812(+) / protein_length=194 / sequence_SO=supercontig / SO=protein_coding / is_pseudo=false